jgi:hypothetical protein
MTMLKSWSMDENPKAEWDDIRAPAHVAKVHTAIKKNFAKYFDSLVEPAAATGVDLFATLGEKYKVTKSARPVVPPKANGAVLVKAITDYQKMAQRYCNIFDGEALQDYRDDQPDTFKTELSRKFPVIMSLLRAGSTELKEWKIKYNLKTSEELLCVFENLLAFANEYMKARGAEATYSKFHEASEFALDGFDGEDMSIPGVVGSGIKSLALYHRHARVFPALGGRSVYGLYFLTDKSFFSLRSESSEFLMISDGLKGRDINMRMDHNYWYPYSLFAEYAMHVANLIQAECVARGIGFDVEYRHVYVDAFFGHIGDVHAADLRIMAGVDELREAMWASK